VAALAVAGLVHPPASTGNRRLAERAARTHEPVLAEGLLAEQVELAGGKVWVANPIDAFSHADQRLYLRWLAGEPRGAAAVGHATLVFVNASNAAGLTAAADPRLVRVATDQGYVLYRVR
jgi:hypothetical protein